MGIEIIMHARTTYNAMSYGFVHHAPKPTNLRLVVLHMYLPHIVLQMYYPGTLISGIVRH